jgi:hypothetical protein
MRILCEGKGVVSTRTCDGVCAMWETRLKEVRVGREEHLSSIGRRCFTLYGTGGSGGEERSREAAGSEIFSGWFFRNNFHFGSRQAVYHYYNALPV